MMNDKKSNVTLEEYDNEFSYKKSKTNLNIEFNRIAFIFFIFLMISIIYSIQLLHLGSLKINREEYLVVKNKNKILLPRKEFELLFLLGSKPEKVFTREEIMNKVWGTQVVVGDRTIDVHIRKLREKIGEKYIKTIKGVGYKFDEEIFDSSISEISATKIRKRLREEGKL